MRTESYWLWIGCLGVALSSTPLSAQSPSTFELIPAWPERASLEPAAAPQQMVPYRPPLTEAQRRGLRIGATAGFLVGGAVGYLLTPDCQPENWVCPLVRPVAATLAVAGGGLVGGVVGGVTGVLIVGSTNGEAQLQVRLRVG
jgi:hypothetical protein